MGVGEDTGAHLYLMKQEEEERPLQSGWAHTSQYCLDEGWVGVGGQPSPQEAPQPGFCSPVAVNRGSPGSL